MLCLLPFLQDLPTYQRSVEAEVLANKQVMTINGYSAAQGVAKQFYNVVMTDLGVYQFINVSLKTPGPRRQIRGVLGSVPDRLGSHCR